VSVRLISKESCFASIIRKKKICWRRNSVKIRGRLIVRRKINNNFAVLNNIFTLTKKGKGKSNSRCYLKSPTRLSSSRSVWRKHWIIHWLDQHLVPAMWTPCIDSARKSSPKSWIKCKLRYLNLLSGLQKKEKHTLKLIIRLHTATDVLSVTAGSVTFPWWQYKKLSEKPIDAWSAMMLLARKVVLLPSTSRLSFTASKTRIGMAQLKSFFLITHLA